MDNLTLLNARKNVYSQNGEDGVIDMLLNFFKIDEGSFCEFGAWDGKHLSNTYNLLENRNWRGVYIEGDKEKYKDLITLKDTYGDRLQTINSFVEHEGNNRLDQLLSNTFLDINFDILSIDVDGMDYHIWKALNNYRPKLVIIEVNSSLNDWENPRLFTIPGTDFNSSRIGASFMAMCELGIQKGYYPIIHFGNIFFGEKDFLKSKNYITNPNIGSLFNWS